MPKKLTQEEFITLAQKVWGDKFDLSLVEYKDSKTKIAVVCKKHGMYYTNPSHFLHGHGCRKCYNERIGDIKRTKLEDFIEKARRVHGDFYDYSFVVYTNNHTTVDIVCPKHGHFKQVPASHLSGRGCPSCGHEKISEKIAKTQEEFINGAIAVHGDRYDYSNTRYVREKKKVEITCKVHGVFLQEPGVHLSGHGCPRCNSSKGEERVRLFLEAHNIKYESQKTFPDLKNIFPLYIDFFLPDYNTAIEYNGAQHYVSVKRWGGDNKLQKDKLRDQIKRDYCSSHGIRLIEIKYTENVEDKLTKELLCKNTLKSAI